MAKSQSTPAEQFSNEDASPGANENPFADFGDIPGQEGDLPPFLQEGFGGSPELMIAREWVRANQLSALFGAFTVGTLLGVLMRR